MTSKKHTKRALLASVLSVVVCVAMLIGSTFAWFTDSVTNSGNKIQAGNLNIDLLVKDENGAYQSVKDSQAAIFDYDKWEPGYTVVKNIKVETKGNLAVKYVVNFVSENAISKLAEAIDVYYAAEEVSVADREGLAQLKKVGTLKDVFDGTAITIEDTLIPGENPADYATIALKMQEDAGNDYQGLALGEFDIRINATQYTKESDSFDDQYDKGAWDEMEKENRFDQLVAEGYKPVASPSDLTQASKTSDKIVVENDLVVDQNTPSIQGSTVVDFNYGKVIRDSRNGSGMRVQNYDADITLQNANFISVEGGTTVRVEKAKSLTVKNSKFICEAPGSTGNMIFQLTPSEAGKKMTVTFENCLFDTGYVGVEGYSNITDYDVRFVNCTFVWDDINGSSFVQAGSYAKGNYVFENCSFTYTNWWSGDLIEIDNYKEKSTVHLHNITVNGSGKKKPYVVSGFSYGGKQNLTATYDGTNKYVYNGEEVAWDTIAVNK